MPGRDEVITPCGTPSLSLCGSMCYTTAQLRPQSPEPDHDRNPNTKTKTKARNYVLEKRTQLNKDKSLSITDTLRIAPLLTGGHILNSAEGRV